MTQFWEEPKQGHQSTIQLLNFSDVDRAMHFQYRCTLVKVSFNLLVGDHEPQEFSTTDPKDALFRIEAHVIFTL